MKDFGKSTAQYELDYDPTKFDAGKAKESIPGDIGEAESQPVDEIPVPGKAVLRYEEDLLNMQESMKALEFIVRESNIQKEEKNPISHKINEAMNKVTALSQLLESYEKESAKMGDNLIIPKEFPGWIVGARAEVENLEQLYKGLT